MDTAFFAFRQLIMVIRRRKFIVNKFSLYQTTDGKKGWMSKAAGWDEVGMQCMQRLLPSFIIRPL